MSTKKQKRERAEAKHKAMMEEYRLSGLAAQKKDRERRARQAQMAKDEAERKQIEKNREQSTKKALADMGRELAEIQDEASLEQECV